MPKRVVKGQALIDFLTSDPFPGNWEPNGDLFGEKVFFVDVLAL